MVWKWNQEVISKTLCVNKDKPLMKCKGKCQLMKMNEENNDAADQKIPPPMSKKSMEWPLFWVATDALYQRSIIEAEEKNGLPLFLMKYFQPHARKTIKPPEYLFSVLPA
jgi:hypothetical protein